MAVLINPEISVIVPVYKVEKYISRCIESIKKQSFKKYELILVDDGSPDQCGDICDVYVKNFEEQGIYCKVIHRDNGGLSAARNSGIEWVFKNSSSNWITFIDSDDWVHRDYLQALYDAACKTKTEVAICLFDRVKDEKEANNQPVFTEPEVIKTEEFWVRSRTNATVAWGKLYKKSFFEKTRYPEGKYHEDEFVTYQILFSCKTVSVVNASLYHYFINEQSITGSDYLKRLPHLLEAFDEHIKYLEHSEYQNAYRLEVEKYAEALSDAIWMIKDRNDRETVDKAKEYRERLKKFLKDHGRQIPFEKRKDIYIAAFPSQKIMICVFGLLKEKVRNDKKHN